MNTRLFSTIFIIIFSIFLLVQCNQKSEYERVIERELKKEKRADSLFLGYYLGMSSEDFFNHSWELNRHDVLTGQSTIFYRFEELRSPALMNFYPGFENDKIHRVPIEIHYEAWSPWNRELHADTLVRDLKRYYEEKFDTRFFQTTLPENNEQAWVSVESNRRIALIKRDDMLVNIEFLDLSVQ